MTPPGRPARVCPDHNVELQEKGSALICPRGDHAVAHWRVQMKGGQSHGRIVFPKCTEERGAVTMAEDRFVKGSGERPSTPRPSFPDPTPPVVGRIELGAAAPRLPVPALAPPSKPAVAASATTEKKVGNVEVLDRAKLVDGSENVLWIRLVRKPTRRLGDKFLVSWRLVPPDGKAVRSGVAAVEDYLEPARAAFAEKVATSERKSWVKRPIANREIHLTEIPNPVPIAPARSTDRPRTIRAHHVTAGKR